MSNVIAITGKGGTGKSTVSAFLVRVLIENGIRPVLAVDADPNSTLAPLLGLPEAATISDIRDDILKEKANITGVPKERLLEMKLQESIQESEGFDLLTMGRPEGQHCYCYVNNLLRGALARLRSSYRAVVIDNEAGMEHLSRMNTDNVDCLVAVSEPTSVGARAVSRIVELTSSLSVTVHRKVIVWNKVVDGTVPQAARDLVEGIAFDDSLLLPLDPGVAQLAMQEDSVLTAAMPGPFAGLLGVCAGDFPETG